MKLTAILTVCFLPLAFVYAQSDQTDSLTITTYYPSPYGVYRQLQVYRGVVYRPLAALPAPSALDQEGELVYVDTNPSDAVPGDFFFRGGGVWQSPASAGDTVLIRSCPWGSDGNTGANNGWGDQCNPATNNCCTLPDCPTGWTEVGTEVKLTSVACPSTEPGLGCEWDPSDETNQHPVAVGRVVRTCVKSGATVITLSSPWRSDHNIGANRGWGNQCGSAPTFNNCNDPGVPAACPAGWTEIGTDIEVNAVSCPVGAEPNDGCFWGSTFYASHPVAAGSVVRICEKD